MSLSEVQLNQLRGALQRSVLDCSERCLYLSAKWAAELLNALPGHGVDGASSHSLPNPIPTTGIAEQHLELKEVPKYLKAKALFDCHEFQRSAAVFLPSSFLELPTLASLRESQPNRDNASAFTRNRVSQKGLFIALYAQFMAGEKLKIEELGQILGISDVGTTVNKQLIRLDPGERGDERSGDRLAAEERVPIFFELGYLDFVDHYSNVLHTLASRERLAFVAQLCSAVDRYRPETCCVVGNYYSLCGRHDDAVMLFRRALVLDRRFSGAWTLLGHEYTELQNIHAAVECYRRAIDLNQHDYRSFVGLGRSYETLDKATFALYYYRRAAKLRPRDADLWQLVANCLIGLTLLHEAAKVLERALTYLGPSTNTKDVSSSLKHSRSKRFEVLYQLAKIYDETENRDEATRLLELCVEEYSATQERSDADESMTGNVGRLIIPKALLLLAEWAISNGDFAKAQAMASRIDIDCELAADAQKILEIYLTSRASS
ncbi:Cdc23 [Metarhizium rileyi]|uniref:Cdc23 n=1 Tax=Metarhizium rileyi (strain RCEF 4871) TaxID=1649241 RepID=A0A166VWK5_METRR|nr:Cdc23 [Metarhizium rileyi RCEF 4871]